MNSWLVRTLQSSVGKKYLMALTGLFWCGFLVAHLAGNFLLFAGEEAFMAYAHALEANKVLMYSAEVLMVIVFFIHVSTAMALTLENKEARPVPYQFSGPPIAASLASRTMIQSGFLVFIFLILHIATFKFGAEPGENLYQNVVRRFSNAPYSLFYVFAVTVLGIHVSHGFQSAFQSLGINHSKYTPYLKKFSHLFGFMIAAGFSSIALYFLMKGGNS